MRNGSFLEISVDALANNAKAAAQFGHPIIAMIKANAYGHGLLECYDIFRATGVKTFGTATLDEAKAIRRHHPEADTEVYVFSDHSLFECYEDYLNLALTPVLWNIDQLDFLLQKAELKHLPIVLKMETGMGRLGIRHDELKSRLGGLRASARGIEHLMQHYATSTRVPLSSSITARQDEVFDQVVADIEAMNISIKHMSCANSGALEQGHVHPRSTMVRPGLWLYGVRSCDSDAKNRAQPVSQLRAKVIHKRRVQKGESAGYGATRIEQDGDLVIVALGYGDGVLTQYGGVKLAVGSGPQVFGRVNMDMTFLLYPPGKGPRIGDNVNIWSRSFGEVEHIARHMASSGYQVLCAISSRVPRHYV